MERFNYYLNSHSNISDKFNLYFRVVFSLSPYVPFFQGDIEVDSETAFELAAYVLQATDGDHTR